MASGQTRTVGAIIPKKSAVSGKIPTGTTAGEIFSNLTDKKLWGYDGVNIFEYGSDTFLNLTGGTISGDIIVNSISANTYLGLPEDISLTSFTYNSANTFTLTNNTGGTLSAIINVMTGLTVNGGLSATTYTGDTITLNTSGSGTVGLLLNTVSNQDSKLHFSTNNAASARGRLYVEDASQTFNLYTFNSDTIFWNGNGLAQSKTLTLYTDTTAKFENKLTVGSLNIQNIPSGVSVYNLAIDSNGNVISAITNSIDVTRVQPGSNISTGGTGNFPVVNLVDSPFVNNINFSGTAIGGTIQAGAVTATSLSAGSISAVTYYGNGINLTGITGAFGITIDGAGSDITPGQKGFVVAPYNMGITGWDLIANTSGNCAIDIWKSATIPTISDSITGLSYPDLINNQFNQNSTALVSWATGITNGDIIAFNVISATSVSRITLTLKTIKK